MTLKQETLDQIPYLFYLYDISFVYVNSYKDGTNIVTNKMHGLSYVNPQDSQKFAFLNHIMNDATTASSPKFMLNAFKYMIDNCRAVYLYRGSYSVGDKTDKNDLYNKPLNKEQLLEWLTSFYSNHEKSNCITKNDLGDMLAKTLRYSVRYPTEEFIDRNEKNSAPITDKNITYNEHTIGYIVEYLNKFKVYVWNNRIYCKAPTHDIQNLLDILAQENNAPGYLTITKYGYQKDKSDQRIDFNLYGFNFYSPLVGFGHSLNNHIIATIRRLIKDTKYAYYLMNKVSRAIETKKDLRDISAGSHVYSTWYEFRDYNPIHNVILTPNKEYAIGYSPIIRFILDFATGKRYLTISSNSSTRFSGKYITDTITHTNKLSKYVVSTLEDIEYNIMGHNTESISLLTMTT
jgi:hypothetical protein